MLTFLSVFHQTVGSPSGGFIMIPCMSDLVELEIRRLGASLLPLVRVLFILSKIPQSKDLIISKSAN